MDACTVCGGTEMNLVDGFYYCLECGTQDMNVRETIVEQTVLGDGTFAFTTSRKITTVVKDGFEMSSEWYKWHIFNFILVGLADELMSLGAKPTFKMKVLWIWMRYVKKFQDADDLQSKNVLGIEDENEALHEEDENETDKEDIHDDNSNHQSKDRKATNSNSDKIIRDMKIITKGTILAILYIALNLDRSDIQLSHLFRFIKEGRLSLHDCMKYVPKELKMNAVKNWKSFTLSVIEHNPTSIRKLCLTFFKVLNLGVPLVPSLKKLVGNYVKELCLPEDVKDLVFALMYFTPIDFLHIDAKIQKSLVRIPDYESICMSYILVALKIGFGLDDDYEVRISKEVDKINDDENYLKSFKLGLFSEPSDRLFSFNEWCQHLQFRKNILCKNYLPMSRQFNSQTDDCTFIEHLEKRRKREVKLSDDVTIDILNKIKLDKEPQTIQKSDFPVTLTPMSTYVDVIAQRISDPDLRLMLCEDFTQYSLKYAFKDFALPNSFSNLNNPVKGISESGKIFNKNVMGTLTVQEGDTTMVYVRNCQNKNWLKTEPPKMHHVSKSDVNDGINDRESDHGYDSNNENSNSENDLTHVTITDESFCKQDKVLDIVEELDVGKSIFDDNFTDNHLGLSNSEHIKEEREETFFEINTQNNLNTQDSKVASLDNFDNYHGRQVSMQNETNTFDRDNLIKDLIELACKKYKISIPKGNDVKKQYKRKANLAEKEVSSSEPKKKRIHDLREAKRDVDHFISAYYNSLHNNILHEVSQQVKSIIENVDNTNNLNFNSEDIINESCNMCDQNDIPIADDLHLNEGIEKSRKENGTNGNVTDNNQTGIDSNEKILDKETIEDNVGDEFDHEIFPKSDPKFNEHEHDIGQLYVKLGENSDADNVPILDISNDPQIDIIIKKQIEKYSNIDINALNMNDIVTDESSSDSDDDVPLSIMKETACFELEKEKRKREIIEPLIKDLSHIKEFNYWVRHYKSNYVVKSRDIGKKFDLEIIENLPASFVFVIRECAAITGYSMFSLYKNMQIIEEMLIANGHREE